MLMAFLWAWIAIYRCLYVDWANIFVIISILFWGSSILRTFTVSYMDRGFELNPAVLVGYICIIGI